MPKKKKNKKDKNTTVKQKSSLNLRTTKEKPKFDYKIEMQRKWHRGMNMA